MALATEVFQRVGCSDTTELCADQVGCPVVDTLHEPRPECVSNPSGIDNGVRRHGGDFRGSRPFDYGAAVFSFGNHEHAGAAEHTGLVQARLLTDQFELVVVAHHYRGTLDPLGKLLP